MWPVSSLLCSVRHECEWVCVMMQQVKDAFTKATMSKTTLFQIWQEKKGDWMEVCFSTGLKIRTINNTESKHHLVTRAQLMTKYDDATIVQEIVDAKTTAGRYIDYPDCPNQLSARLYFAFNTTDWTNGNWNETEQALVGSTTRLSAAEALAIAARMQTSALVGPATFATPPPLTLTFNPGVGSTADDRSNTEVAGAAAGGGAAGGGKGKPKGGRTPRTSKGSSKGTGKNKGAAGEITGDPMHQPEDGTGDKNKKVAKPPSVDIYFKLVGKVLTDLTDVDQLVILMKEKGKDADPFIALLHGHKINLGRLYEQLRETANQMPPPMEQLATVKCDLDKAVAGMKVDSGRMTKMFKIVRPGAKTKASQPVAAELDAA